MYAIKFFCPNFAIHWYSKNFKTCEKSVFLWYVWHSTITSQARKHLPCNRWHKTHNLYHAIGGRILAIKSWIMSAPLTFSVNLLSKKIFTVIHLNDLLFQRCGTSSKTTNFTDPTQEMEEFREIPTSIKCWFLFCLKVPQKSSKIWNSQKNRGTLKGRLKKNFFSKAFEL